MNDLVMNLAERKQYADRIRPIAADYDEWGITNIHLQIRETADGTPIRRCLVTFDSGDELVEGGRPLQDNSPLALKVLLDETYPSLVALTETQPAMAETIIKHIEGGFR